jgi:hypothetical protein
MVAKVGLVISTPRESGPRVDNGAKLESQPEPAPSHADETSPERVLETLEKPDDGAWSMPPQHGAHASGEEESRDPTGPLPPPPSEEAINIVLEEELVPSSPQTPTSVMAAPRASEPEITQTKPLRDRFPFRPGAKR